jgi:hypothetical protein
LNVESASNRCASSAHTNAKRPMTKPYTNVELTEEYIVVVFDLDYSEDITSMKRHVDAFPLGYVQVEVIENLAIVCIYPGGAMELLR